MSSYTWFTRQCAVTADPQPSHKFGVAWPRGAHDRLERFCSVFLCLIVLVSCRCSGIRGTVICTNEGRDCGPAKPLLCSWPGCRGVGSGTEAMSMSVQRGCPPWRDSVLVVHPCTVLCGCTHAPTPCTIWRVADIGPTVPLCTLGVFPACRRNNSSHP